MIALRLGSHGQDVVKLQILLNGHLNPAIRIMNDGHFGRLTRAAVEAFQKKKGLPIDGVVGVNTWNALTLGGAKLAHKIDLTPSTIGAPWCDIAAAEIGVKALAGPGLHEKRIIEYHKTTTYAATTDEVAWCSAFVNWVMIQAGIEGTNSAAAKSWIKWGLKVNAPAKGDIIVVQSKKTSGYHVGFYLDHNHASVRILGGNQGKQVNESNFLLRSWDIIAYRRPPIRIIGVPLSTHLRYSAFA